MWIFIESRTKQMDGTDTLELTHIEVARTEPMMHFEKNNTEKMQTLTATLPSLWLYVQISQLSFFSSPSLSSHFSCWFFFLDK